MCTRNFRRAGGGVISSTELVASSSGHRHCSGAEALPAGSGGNGDAPVEGKTRGRGEQRHAMAIVISEGEPLCGCVPAGLIRKQSCGAWSMDPYTQDILGFVWVCAIYSQSTVAERTPSLGLLQDNGKRILTATPFNSKSSVGALQGSVFFLQVSANGLDLRPAYIPILGLPKQAGPRCWPYIWGFIWSAELESWRCSTWSLRASCTSTRFRASFWRTMRAPLGGVR